MRGMQEANLPVDFVDQEVPNVAYVLVDRVDELAVDQVAWHKEDVRPVACVIHKEAPFSKPVLARGPSDGMRICCHLWATSASSRTRRGRSRAAASVRRDRETSDKPL